jgi:transposase
VLSEFRTRLVTGRAEQQLLDTLLERFRERQWLKARGRQRTDSTHVLAAIRTLNRLESVGETLRHPLNVLAVVAPDWIRAHSQPEWADRYGPRCEEYRLPTSKEERQAFAEAIGADGLQLLTAIDTDPHSAWLAQVPAVQTLRQIWTQQYHIAAGVARWRTSDDLAPAAEQLHSPSDPDARYGKKRSTTWVGYKVHLTETCEPDAPSQYAGGNHRGHHRGCRHDPADSRRPAAQKALTRAARGRCGLSRRRAACRQSARLRRGSAGASARQRPLAST